LFLHKGDSSWERRPRRDDFQTNRGWKPLPRIHNFLSGVWLQVAWKSFLRGWKMPSKATRRPRNKPVLGTKYRDSPIYTMPSGRYGNVIMRKQPISPWDNHPILRPHRICFSRLGARAEKENTDDSTTWKKEIFLQSRSMSSMQQERWLRSHNSDGLFDNGFSGTSGSGGTADR
jgi:hypothetical protein